MSASAFRFTPEEGEHFHQHLIGVLMARGMTLMEALRYPGRMDEACGHNALRGAMWRLELAESNLPPEREAPTLHRAVEKWRRVLAPFAPTE